MVGQIVVGGAERSGGASPAEAAAIVAAVSRFLRDTAPAPAPEAPVESRWLQVARMEAVRGELRGPSGWRGGVED